MTGWMEVMNYGRRKRELARMKAKVRRCRYCGGYSKAPGHSTASCRRLVASIDKHLGGRVTS